MNIPRPWRIPIAAAGAALAAAGVAQTVRGVESGPTKGHGDVRPVVCEEPTEYSHDLGADTEVDVASVKRLVNQIASLQKQGVTNITVQYAVLADDIVLSEPNLGIGTPDPAVKDAQIQRREAQFIAALSKTARQSDVPVSLQNVLLRRMAGEERVLSRSSIDYLNDVSIAGGYSSAREAISAYQHGEVKDAETVERFDEQLPNGVKMTLSYVLPSPGKEKDAGRSSDDRSCLN